MEIAYEETYELEILGSVLLVDFVFETEEAFHVQADFAVDLLVDLEL